MKITDEEIEIYGKAIPELDKKCRECDKEHKFETLEGYLFCEYHHELFCEMLDNG